MPRITFKDPTFKPNIGVYSYGEIVPGQQVNGQFEFDVSTFRDPQGQQQFAGKNGLDKSVIAWIRTDRRIPTLIKECRLLAEDLVRPKANPEIKGTCVWLSFCFRDKHGKWISPAIAEIVGDALSDAGFNVVVTHPTLKNQG